MRTPTFVKAWRQRSAKLEADLVPLPWRLSTLLVLMVVVGGGFAALWLTNRWADEHMAGVAATDAPLVAVRLDAIKTALTVAAGLGAGVTLLLTLRRQNISERAQRTIERAQRHTEQDAAERRITDLYVAAVEQLGSDTAPVRLGGMYALERIGNDHPKMRQTIMNVWCAYLRMSFTPPSEILQSNSDHSPEHLTAQADAMEPKEQPTRQQELQVRLTAQQLLLDHLRAPEDEPEPSTYWRGPGGQRMNLNLARANLVNLDLLECQIGRLVLARCHIHGWADLRGLQLHEWADLRGVQFHGYVELIDGRFWDGASLVGARFYGETSFSETRFHNFVYLQETRFCEQTKMTKTQFPVRTDLSKIQFIGEADLDEARFEHAPEVNGMKVKNQLTIPAGWTTNTAPDADGLYEVLTAQAPLV